MILYRILIFSINFPIDTNCVVQGLLKCSVAWYGNFLEKASDDFHKNRFLSADQFIENYPIDQIAIFKWIG